MEQKSATLAKKRRERASLPKSSEVVKKPKVKKPKVKKTKEPKPDPFTAIEVAREKRKKKWLTTPKDTRQPRSQNYWGRHRGPKLK